MSNLSSARLIQTLSYRKRQRSKKNLQNSFYIGLERSETKSCPIKKFFFSPWLMIEKGEKKISLAFQDEFFSRQNFYCLFFLLALTRTEYQDQWLWLLPGCLEREKKTQIRLIKSCTARQQMEVGWWTAENLFFFFSISAGGYVSTLIGQKRGAHSEKVEKY